MQRSKNVRIHIYFARTENNANRLTGDQQKLSFADGCGANSAYHGLAKSVMIYSCREACCLVHLITCGYCNARHSTR